MTVIVPIRADSAYFGISKEVVPGTPAAPVWFPRWMDGSNIEIDLKAEDVWEGDGSRRLSQIVKNRQMVKIKLTCSPRMNEVGFLEEATQGTGSDTYTAPTVATTLSALTAVGATSITVAANTGLTGAGTIALIINPGATNEEIALFNVPATGVGPYTLTVAAAYNGGNGLKLAHANTVPIKSSASHVLVDTADGDYFTVEVGLGNLNGAAGTALRVRTCKVESCKVSGKAGGLLMYELEFVGIASSVQGTPATITLEQHPLFLYTQGVWTLDSSAGGDALTIESFDIERKNNCDTSIQTEQLTLAAIIFGNVTVGLGFEIVYTNANRIFLIYFGGTSGTTDAQAIGAGAFSVTFTQPDTFETITYTMATTHYSKIGLPSPKKDGKAFKQAVSASSVSNSGANTNVLQTTITNSQYASY